MVQFLSFEGGTRSYFHFLLVLNVTDGPPFLPGVGAAKGVRWTLFISFLKTGVERGFLSGPFGGSRNIYAGL